MGHRQAQGPCVAGAARRTGVAGEAGVPAIRLVLS